MKSAFLILGLGTLVSASAVSAVIAHNRATPLADAPTTQPTAPVAENKMCAVIPADPVSTSVPTVQYKGHTIGFCCPDCVDEFKAHPEKYFAALNLH